VVGLLNNWWIDLSVKAWTIRRCSMSSHC